MGIGKRLKEARLRKNYTQAELANLVGITNGAIGNYENETSHPKTEILLRIFKILEVDANYLWQDDMDITQPLTLKAEKVGRAYEKAPPREQGIVEAVLEPYMDTANGKLKVVGVVSEVAELAEFEEPEMADLFLYEEPAAAGLGNYLEGCAYEVIQIPANKVPAGTDMCIKIKGDSMEPNYPDGCSVFVAERLTLEDGQIGIFKLDGKSYCKKLRIDYEQQQIHLVSLNKKYADVNVSKDSDLRTVGRVLGVVE